MDNQQANRLNEESSRALQALAEATGLIIASPNEYHDCLEETRTVKVYAKQLKASRDAILRPLDESRKHIMDLYRVPMDALKRAEDARKQAMGRWDDEQEALRRAEEARQRAIARKERERLEARAAAAAKKGEAEKAEVLEEAAAAIPEPIVSLRTPKAAGVSRASVWKCRVMDKAALIQAVADGKAPTALLDVNQAALNAEARALRKELAYPGVEAYEERDMRIRT